MGASAAELPFSFCPTVNGGGFSLSLTESLSEKLHFLILLKQLEAAEFSMQHFRKSLNSQLNTLSSLTILSFPK